MVITVYYAQDHYPRHQHSHFHHHQIVNSHHHQHCGENDALGFNNDKVVLFRGIL